MKKHYILYLLLLITTFNACKKDDIAYGNDFDKSYQSWLSFKKSSNNAYQYLVTNGSWTGESWQTTLTVKEGKVVDRSFTRQRIDRNTSKPVVVESWQEDEASLNQHTDGAATETLDEVYSRAKSEWLVKKEDADVYFETKNQGMISTCGYSDRKCVDDCFTGIRIQYIKAI